MKKSAFVITSILALSALASCNNPFYSATISLNGSGRVYARGSQEVTVTIGDDEKASFSSKISASCFTMKDELQGKSVESVTYISEKEIRVTFGGNGTISDNSSYVYAECTISSKGFTNNTTANVLLTYYARAPHGTASISSYRKSGNVYSIELDVTVEEGTINADKCTADYVVSSGTTLITDVSYDNGSLLISCSKTSEDETAKLDSITIRKDVISVLEKDVQVTFDKALSELYTPMAVNAVSFDLY